MSLIHYTDTPHTLTVKIAPILSKRYDINLPARLHGSIDATEYAYSIQRCNDALNIPRSQQLRLILFFVLKLVPLLMWLPLDTDGTAFANDKRFMLPGLIVNIVIVSCAAMYYRYIYHQCDIRFFSAVQQEHEYYSQRCREFGLPAISWSVNVSPSWWITRQQEDHQTIDSDPLKQPEKGTRATEYRILIEVARDGSNEHSNSKQELSDIDPNEAEPSYSLSASPNNINNDVLIQMPLVSHDSKDSMP